MAEKDDKKRALDLALSQIEKQYGKGAIMKLGDADCAGGRSGDFDGIARPGYCAWRRRISARACDRDFWPGGIGKDDPDPACDR